MADISNKRKQRKNQRNNKKRKISKTSTSPPEKKTLEIVKKSKNQNPEKKKKKQQQQQQQLQQLGKNPIVHDNSNEVVESESERVQKLLEPYTKEQLIDFLCDAAVSNSSLFERIKNTADQDVSHRKIFVHGLGWDTTQETLKSVFQSFGEIEECRLVLDRTTGKAKGYGFVLFKSRTSAAKALKDPQKKINNRVASCQLASIGPVTANQTQDNSSRKIYVSNVHADADPQKLCSFFAKFGEIEMGPLGFDMLTGKSRGFALFLYKTQEGAKKVLEEPYKMFEGHQLHCQRASENKNKASVQQQQPQPTQPPVLAAVAAAQNLAIFNQHPSLNPMYSGLDANPNPGFIPGSVNPMIVGAMNQSLIASHQMPASSLGLGLGGYSGFGGYGASHGLGILGGNPSLLGAQASANPAFQGSSMNPAFPGLQSYQNSTLGQSSSARTYGATGSLPGYPSYMCLAKINKEKKKSNTTHEIDVVRHGSLHPRTLMEFSFIVYYKEKGEERENNEETPLMSVDVGFHAEPHDLELN